MEATYTNGFDTVKREKINVVGYPEASLLTFKSGTGTINFSCECSNNKIAKEKINRFLGLNWEV